MRWSNAVLFLWAILFVSGCTKEEGTAPISKAPSKSPPPSSSTGDTNDPEPTPTQPSVPSPPPETDVAVIPKEAAPSVAPPPVPTPVAAKLPIGEKPIVGTPPEAFRFAQPPLELPKVMLSDVEASMCKIKVGDTMPDLQLPDLQGGMQQLSKLLGPKLTVVAFWTATQPFAIEEIGDLGPVVAARFADHGVKVIGISERGSAASAKSALEKAAADFVNLVDTDGKALALVATEQLPRTYLLDANGKVIWFDIEYSRSTRRDLVHAIQFVLRDDK